MELIFVRGNTLASKAIAAFEGGRASHVGIRFAMDPALLVDTSMRHGGVQIWQADAWLAGYDHLETINVRLPDEAAAHQFVRMQLGKPYDWTALAGFLAWRDWSQDDAWYCSELAAAAMMAGGLTLADRQRRVGVRLLREIAHAHRSAWCDAAVASGVA